MKNAVNRITFYQPIVPVPVIKSQEEWYERADGGGGDGGHACNMIPRSRTPYVETRSNPANIVPNQYLPNIYQEPYHWSHLVH